MIAEYREKDNAGREFRREDKFFVYSPSSDDDQWAQAWASAEPDVIYLFVDKEEAES